jgi:ABC-type multidrug transport system ATPase subunit
VTEQQPAQHEIAAADAASGNGKDPLASVSIRGLNVVAGERTLLEDTAASFPAGRITLLVGPSGVGKSVLMKIIAGLVPASHDSIHFEGDIRINGRQGRRGDCGVVFQSFALFDELSPRGNVQFAESHARQKINARPAELLRELNVPNDVRTVLLSGGQRQRLAIARTIAYNPDVILFDEPTSGLDPENSRKVGELIRETSQQHHKTAIVVTHDYESLLSIADTVYVLNPIERRLQEVPRESWDRLSEILQPMAMVAAQKSDDLTETRLNLKNAGKLAARFLAGTSRSVENLIWGLCSVIPIWKSPRWGLRYLGHYMRLVFGPTAWFYLTMAGIITGFVTTYYIFQFLPFALYTEPLLVDDLLSATGFSLYRIFVPVLATVLIAARCGAAVTADTGSKQYSSQIDALQTFGVSPRAYLLTPIMISFLIGVPLLTMIAFVTAKYTSLLTFTLTHVEHGPNYWNQYFHKSLHVVNQLWYYGSGWLLSKLTCCAVGIALISYHIGLRPKFSSSDVSKSVTATILWSTLFVLIVHFCFAFYEFNDQIKG